METTFGHYTAILKKVVGKKITLKVLITTPKGIVRSFQVTVPKPLDFRVIYENVKVRTRHSRFDGFAYFLDLFKLIDYQISRSKMLNAVSLHLYSGLHNIFNPVLAMFFSVSVLYMR